MASTGRVARIAVSRAPRTGRVARIAASTPGIVVPKTGRVASIVATAPGVAPGPRTGVVARISVSVPGATGPARGRISRIAASVNPGGISLPLAGRAIGGKVATVTAAAAGATLWEWSQSAGPTVAFTTNGGVLQFTAPRLKATTPFTFQVRAQIGGVWTAWAAANVTVQRHPNWVKRGGVFVPLLRGVPGVSSPVFGDTTVIPCYGDSMVAGFGIGAPASFPSRLNLNLPGGRTTINYGVSSQTAQEVALRQGGKAISLVFPSNTIPASGAVTVTTPDTIVWGAVAWSVVGTVGGVVGTLSHPSGTAGTNTATLTWTRSGSGSTVPLGGASSFVSNAGDRDKVQVFLAGRNDYGIGGVDSTIRTRVIDANKAMVDRLTTPYFIVLSNLTLMTETSGSRGYNNVTAVNATLASMYGERFLDVRRKLIDEGMAALHITPTSQDLAAVAADTMPPSLMFDNIHWSADAADLVADWIYERLLSLHYLPGNDVTPTLGLPFKMPDLSGSTKKVFAHYFGPYPRSLNNAATMASDQYTTIYNNPGYTGTYGTGPANVFGGAFRDRPLWRPQITGDFKYQDCVWDIQQAKAAGIDGFFPDLLGLSGTNYDNYETLRRAACDASFPFYVIPMVDGNGATATATAQTAAAYVKRFAIGDGAKGAARLKSAYFLPDGRYVVSCFKAEAKPLSWWTDLFFYLKNDWGLDVAFIGVYNNYNQAGTYSGISYGSGPWGYGADDNVINAASNMAVTARGRGEKFMAPVVAQDQRPMNALFDQADGFDTFIAAWNKAINQEADFVQLVTWSDFSETAIAPSAANGWSLLDLSAYFTVKYKTGQYPSLLRDAIYLAHRGQTLDAAMTGGYGQTKFMQHWARGSMSPVTNDVHVVTMLTAAANITVTVGAATFTYAAPAGFYQARFPAQAAAAGAVKVDAKRSTTTVATVTSPVAIRASAVTDDRQYFRFSSVRGTAGQFDPLTQYT